MDDPAVIEACQAFQAPQAYMPHPVLTASIRRALIAACESKADSLSAPLPGNAYPLEWQEIVQRFLREWAREMKEGKTMAKYRKRGVFDAVQWFKDGDHKSVTPIHGAGDNICSGCGHASKEHGFLGGIVVVCVGSWIVTGEDGRDLIVSPEVFAEIYEPASSHR